MGCARGSQVEWRLSTEQKGLQSRPGPKVGVQLVKVVRTHGTTREIAKNKVEGLLPSLMQQHGSSVTNSMCDWRGDVMGFAFRARGVDFKGTLHVTESAVILDIDLPFLARMAEPQIRSAVEAQFDRIWR